MYSNGETVEPQVGRDLERAQWQRSVGQVVMTELFDIYMEQEVELNYEKLQLLGQKQIMTASLNQANLWARAHEASHQAFPYSSINRDDFKKYQGTVIEEGMYRFTHMQDLVTVFNEAIQTQARFPINLAREISEHARKQAVPNLEANNLSDIADILTHPSMEALVQTALLTRNSVWQTFSSTERPTGESFTDNGDTIKLGFVFEDDKIEYHPSFVVFLRNALRRVNQPSSDQRGEPVERQSSSGCPVRSKRPQFTASSEDQANLLLLSTLTNKSVEQLTAPRHETVQATALRRAAHMLRRADQFYDAFDS